ncbi:MAG TPA: purine-nucleoside phosphorylase [Candidatus Krumholzibacteria bacterium]|nr:purine-nucleoside phosphorylase [Candidatus Krumholzibacteria bacterium]
MSARHLAVIAGSGMGALAALVDAGRVVPFADIDGVGACGVDGHAGEVRTGTIGSRPCTLVLGRRHGYEGEFGAVERLVAWLADNGTTDLLVASAAGGLRAHLEPGDLVVFHDLLDRQDRPPGPDRLGLDPGLTREVEAAARRAGVLAHRGTAVCGIGPAYETRAEVAALQLAGGDVATMSGAPEIAAARAVGLRVAAVALVTNPCTGIAAAVPSHADVLRVGRESSGRLAALVSQLVVNM